ETALEYYQEFIEQRGDDPGARAELAATRDQVKKILADLSLLQGDANLFLLNEPDVLDDLGVHGRQRGEVAELLRIQGERRHESFQDFHRLNAEERRQRFIELARRNDAE